MPATKVSLSLDPSDVEFLDAEAGAGRFRSRSAAAHAAIALLREARLADDYASAFDEWNDDAWDIAAPDGLGG